jgi:hypothetical protein
VVELKETKSSPDSDYDSDNNKKRQIIDAKPTATIATATIQLEEPEDPEEGRAPFPFTNVGEADPTTFYC